MVTIVKNSGMRASQHPLYLCATSRLARGMQLRAHLESTQTAQTSWQTVQAYTVSQWLNQTIEAAMMLGQIPLSALPAKLLNGFAETYLWELAITQCLEKHEAAALFDVKSLAKTAIHAHQTLIDWQVPIADVMASAMSQETRQFLRWQQKFLALCQDKQACDASTYFARQVDLICQYSIPLPPHIVFAGFDRMTPIMQHLIRGLKAHHLLVEVEDATQPLVNGQQTVICTHALQTAEEECLAAVAWAKATLTQYPAAQIAIISPNLADDRARLIDLLDDAFHADTILPDRYESSRIYDSSIGLALRDYPIIHSALTLLGLLAMPQHQPFATLSPILHDVYWGALSELAPRASLDAYLRGKTTPTTSFSSLLRLAKTHWYQTVVGTNNVDPAVASGIPQPHYLNALQGIHDRHTEEIQRRSKQLPSEWLALFVEFLEALRWAQTRSLSSIEYQTQQRFLETMHTLAQQDSILGLMSAQACLNALSTMCQQTMFQAEAVGNIQIQLLGLLETPALALDAIWVMHMNDQHWPPPVKLNPLLPVKLQRDLGLPNASSQVQMQFAHTVQSRVNQMARTIVFSYALNSGDQDLRPSPLLSNFAVSKLGNPMVQNDAASDHLPRFTPLSSALAQASLVEYIDDHMATNIDPSDTIRGGTQLFKRQAICPAWAFYQHRLGANALATPSDGLESKDHGNLLHIALEQFWLACAGAAALKAMTDDVLDATIMHAIQLGINRWQDHTNLQISQQILKIEALRMHQSIRAYLLLEKNRADFLVAACEKETTHNIAGIPLKLTIDRIDTLMDETLKNHIVIMDYKTSSQVSHASWAQPRITEPQLPIYATLARQQGTKIAAVYFVQINPKQLGMRGLAVSQGIVPGLVSFDALRSNSPFTKFADWSALLDAWDTSLTLIGEEIKNGEARVAFQKRSDLTYCEVLPLLRLPERLDQLENIHANAHSTPSSPHP